MPREYNEVVAILDCIPKEDLSKVPKNMINMFKSNIDREYNLKFNPQKTLEEQNISREAKTIIAILFRDYWATPQQREKILAKEKFDIEKIEKEKRDKYNSNNVFANKDRIDNKIINDNENTMNMQIAEYKEPFLKKIINKILHFFHIN